MRIQDGELLISASDVANHLACRHLTMLDLLAAGGEIKRIYRNDPSLEALEQRGRQHEAAYLAHVKAQGFQILQDGSYGAGFERTVSAMKAGVEIIPQAYLLQGMWNGYADVLRKVSKPSKLGNWSYEVIDTKLAQETRAGTILQLCLYSEIVASIQGEKPEWMYVVSPGRNFEGEKFRVKEYEAYYRFVKNRLERQISADLSEGINHPLIPSLSKEGKSIEPASTASKEGKPVESRFTISKEGKPVELALGAGWKPAVQIPGAVEHCEICGWWLRCNQQRRDDDHLSFVAGISKLQITELRNQKINKLADLAVMPFPLTFRPDRGSKEAYEKIREQARLQLEFKNSQKPVYDLLALEPERGLARLPEPSPGDIFLDFEADPFIEDGGMEYLLGYALLSETGEPQYTASWGLNRTDERRAFEAFIDMVMERLSHFPDLHIYHFSHYEPSALKRLMGRYATREDEIDRMLRAGLFVDLHAVVKQALRASVEKYSLKDLEIFFDFHRTIDLRDASRNLRHLECALEMGRAEDLTEDVLKTIEGYNREDCISTLELRNWLEKIRTDLIRKGSDIKRPAIQDGEPSEEVDEHRKRVLELMERLLQGVPDVPSERTPEHQASWLLAHMLEFHRREEKAPWWEFFRLQSLTDEERLEEPSAIAGLKFLGSVGGTPQCPIDQYEFPVQDAEVREDDHLEMTEGPFGKVVGVDAAQRTIDVRKRGDTANVHPTSVFIHNIVTASEQAKSLFRIGSWVAEHGVDADGTDGTDGKYRAARDLLLRKPPRLGTEANGSSPLSRGRSGGGCSDELSNPPLTPPFIRGEENYADLPLKLDDGVLPIQGPPGAGKTHTGARMICALLRANKKIGITAVSHKVIGKMIHEVLKAAAEEKLQIHGIQKVPEISEVQNPLVAETKKNNDVLAALRNGEAQFAGGTAWLWAREEFAEAVDVLFVDEAGQMSLPDVLSVSQAAKSIVLLGDPQQLEQPLQGTHPPGVAVSSLEHILGDAKTIPPERGVFLEETWRLSSAICDFTSELFYENRLHPREELKEQKLTGSTPFAGCGLWVVPVDHEGNQSSSEEEAAVVEKIVRDLIDSDTHWIDPKGESRRLQLNDILIVAPYNAQVFKIAERIARGSGQDARAPRIGTVDKFQGQEAPVVIYSMTTSSPEDAPHGMEFLYSLNRFNVATSRARCVCILVANPALFEPDCKTPRQIKLANALCRYREMARLHR